MKSLVNHHLCMYILNIGITFTCEECNFVFRRCNYTCKLRLSTFVFPSVIGSAKSALTSPLIAIYLHSMSFYSTVPLTLDHRIDRAN